MSGKTVKLYELCTKENNRVFSPFCWRTRLACLHKGLTVETIPWRFTEKDRIKFADSDKVPVLIDGDKTVKESFDIALYLEKTYPNGPTLFGGKEGEASARFADNYANIAIGEIFPAILPEVWSQLNKADADYFREDREKMFGGKLEEVSKNPKEKIEAFRKALEPLRTTLGQQKFVGGDQPIYADYVIASIILCPQAVSKLQLLEKDDPVLAWYKRILAKYENNLKGVLFAWQLP